MHAVGMKRPAYLVVVVVEMAPPADASLLICISEPG
jgi:hypothetical protein